METKTPGATGPFASGHTACAGCAAAIIIRTVMQVMGPDTIVGNATSCSEIFSSAFPRSAWRVPYVHVNFENAAPVATGVVKALEDQGNDHTKVIVIAGDGSTYDIGWGHFSGALERNENFLYVCYDNECYANTGVQRSGATPYKAWTTTSQIGKNIQGKQEWKKNIAFIAAMHNVPYVASASVGFLPDLEAKVRKAKEMKGMRFIDVFSPCPTGWYSDTQNTINIGKLAVESGLWALFEIEDGMFKKSMQPKFIPVKDYLGTQRRFAHLKDADYEYIARHVKEAHEELDRLQGCGVNFKKLL